MSLCPPPYPPPLDWSTHIFFLLIVLLLLWSWIACLPGQTPTYSGLKRLSLFSLHFLPRPSSQRPSRPLNPRAACLFLPPLTPSVISPFSTLNVVSLPVDIYVCSLLVSILLPPLTQITLLPCRPWPAGLDLTASTFWHQPAAQSLPVPRRFAS